MYINSDNYYKYIKYKYKYIKLKNIKNQVGGAIETSSIINDKSTILAFLSPLVIPFTMNKMTYDVNGYIIHIIKIILNQDDKPVLFALAGISHKSFVGTSTVILSKLNLLKEKFKEIYLVEYDSYKPMQNIACEMRNKNKKSKNIDKIYKPELDMNDNIANNLNEIILQLNLTNVHLLGKCNGAWVVTLLLLKNNIYKGLYLAVPGIPFNVDILNQLSNNRLEEINFVFGWVQQDAYEFDWGNKSFEEKPFYDKTIKQIEKEKGIDIKYKTKMYDNGKSKKDNDSHEISPLMINDIISTL